eukprot:jgi/Mesvir1/6820/Mv26504-RA.1
MARASSRQVFSYLAHHLTRGLDCNFHVPRHLDRAVSLTRWARAASQEKERKWAGLLEKRYYSHLPDSAKQHPVSRHASDEREVAENQKAWPEEDRPPKPDPDESLIRRRLGALWGADSGVNLDVARHEILPEFVVNIYPRLPKWAQQVLTEGKQVAIQLAIDSSFDPADFMEGARHAFMRVNQLLSQRDIAGMRDMVVPSVQDAYENAWAFYRARGYSVTFKVESLTEARVHNVVMCNREALGVPEWHTAAAQAEEGNPASITNNAPSDKKPAVMDAEASPPRSGDATLCLVVAVGYTAVERLVIASPEGKVIIDETCSRPRLWYFARALPSAGWVAKLGQAKALESPWVVAGVQLPF